jgi:nickel/cobalt transporter (NicO) family protein
MKSCISIWRRRRATLPAIALWLIAGVSAAFAVQTPFGIATPDSTSPAFTGPLGGLFAWVALRQAAFYHILTSTLADIKHSGHAALLLAGVSLLYGIFHAVGPGHGKSVITSYLLVQRQTARRGIVISFTAALMQGLVAIAVVLVAAVILRATAIGMTQTTDWFLIFSYALITAVGAWLLWSKLTGRGHHHAHEPGHDRDHGHGHHDHHHDHAHDHDDACGHSHVPDPRLLSKPLTLSRAWAAILAVGIRPCSGAIIVLVFALSQQLLLAGIASVLVMSLGTAITVSTLAILAVSAKDVALRVAGADSPTTERVVRVLEVGAAAFVMLLGLTLLGGALAGGLPG